MCWLERHSCLTVMMDDCFTAVSADMKNPFRVESSDPGLSVCWRVLFVWSCRCKAAGFVNAGTAKSAMPGLICSGSNLFRIPEHTPETSSFFASTTLSPSHS
jgi:hypothetical protein